MTTPDYTGHNFVDYQTPISAAILNDDEAAIVSLHNIVGINPKDYGAKGDGVTDDHTALQNALNAVPAGGICNMPVGKYAISAPIVVPPGITWRASHSDSLNYTGALPSPVNVKVLAGFTGAAVVVLQGKYEGGYTTHNVGTRVERITIDGTSAPAAIKGFQTNGYVREATFDRCTATRVTGNGFSVDVDAASTDPSTSAQSLRFLHCIADNVGAAGFSWNNCPDTTVFDCNSEGAAYIGFYIAGMPNSQIIACRSEWSAQHNYYITSGYWGTGQGSGGTELFGCLSDRANFNGVYVDATGNDVIGITACRFRRDGRNGGTGGGGYAAVSVAATATMPVLVSASKTYPGVDDNGGGTASPQYGLAVAAGAPVTTWLGGRLWGVTAATGGTGTPVIDNSVLKTTGASTAPVNTNPTA